MENAFEYVIIRTNRRGYKLSVDGEGRLKVYLPRYAKNAEAERIIREHADWVEKNVAKATKNAEDCPALKLVDGEKILLFGEEKVIALTDNKKPFIEEDKLFLPREKSAERLAAFYKEALKPVIAENVAKYSGALRVLPSSVGFSSAKTRWGSCSGKNVLTFTWRLAMAPEEVVAYVVAHETSHILHKNHSRSFWACVERICPEYKARRAWLKAHSRLTRIV